MVRLKYDTEIDLTDMNTSHALMVAMVGGNKRVLDVGCATGYLARALVDQGCVVSGLEQDAAAAAEAAPHIANLVVADLETTDLVEAFGAAKFDVVLFGDVLEHLRDPLAVLRQARPLLAPGGSVIASIPNVAHGSVRLALLRGRFDYQPLGLLDHTHLRFFTRRSIEAMFSDAGMVAVEIRRTTTGIFDGHVRLDESEYPPELIESVLEDPEALTYQFVVKGISDDADAAISALQAREQAQRERILALEKRLEAVERERDDAHADVGRLMATRVIRYTRPLRNAYAALRG